MAEDTPKEKINVRDMLKNFQTENTASTSTLRPQSHLQYVVTTHKKSSARSPNQTTKYNANSPSTLFRPQPHLQHVGTMHNKKTASRSQTLTPGNRLTGSSGGSDIVDDISIVKSRLRRRKSSELGSKSGKETSDGVNIDEIPDRVSSESIPEGIDRDTTTSNGSSNHSNNLPINPSIGGPVEESIEAHESFNTESQHTQSAMLDSDKGSSVVARIAILTAPTLPRQNSGNRKEDPGDEESPYSDLHIVPLRENKLLKNELFRDRRRSRSVGDLTMLKIDQFTGLFQRARATRCSSDAWNDSANKPPIAAKPQIPKKPPITTSKPSLTKPPVVHKPTLSTNLKPALHGSAPDIGSKQSHWENHNGNPPVTKSQSFEIRPKVETLQTLESSNPPIATLQSHENEDDPGHIYDEVYQQPTSKDLRKYFGTTPTPATDLGFATRPNVDLNQSYPPPFAEKPKNKHRKHSRNRTEPSKTKDDPTPYAVSQPLHPADKGDKINHRRKKSSQTSVDRSDRSWDSGVAGLQMLAVPSSTRARFGGSTKSEDSDFGSTTSDQDSGSEGWDEDSWDSTTDSQAPEPINFVDESHKVAYEVLTSERTYVERLNLLEKVFLARIERENERAHWFSVDIIKEIFSNLRSIYAFHCNFLLPELENRLKTWEQNPSIGDILKRLAPFLKLYSDYVKNFDNSMKLLNFWSQKAPKFGSLLGDIQRRPECMNLALQHHMLEPVQRIPRYELLLKDYLKRLPLDSQDRANAEEALKTISSAAHHSNDMMKTTDQFQKLLKLNDKIEGEDIIDPSRQLLKEGKIVKIAARGGNHTHKEMYLFLFNDMILCCIRGKILKRVTYTVKHKLDVDGMKILDAENCKFRVESKQKALELQTTSEEEKEEWMKSIISAVHEMVRKKQTFINNDAINDRPASGELQEECELGMRAPRWIKDEEVTMCMRCGTDFKAITRRRHHCRACGAVVCNKCSSYDAQLPYDDNKVNRVCYKCYFTFKGEEEGAKEQMRRLKHEEHENVNSLITEIDEENSFSSFLSVLQKREWVRFWVVATKQDLFALKAPKDVRPVLTLPIKLYKLCEITDSDGVDKPHAFKLSDSSRSQHIFAADTRELKKRWMMVFNDGVESVLKTKYMTESDHVFQDPQSSSSSSSSGSLKSFSPSHKSYTVNAT